MTARMTHRFGVFVLIVAAAFGFASATAESSAPTPFHASVLEWTQQYPGEPVPLIVQHDGTPDELLTFVAESGGSVEREFQIIPALDVNLPADALDELAGQGDLVWASLDAPLQSTGSAGLASGSIASSLTTAYPYAARAVQAWSSATGSGVTVALIDTGVSEDAAADFVTEDGLVRVQSTTVRSDVVAEGDGFGHGTHVAGAIGGLSTATDPVGAYTGIAPEANLLSVRIADDEGNATVGDLLAGLEFVDDNRDVYNIGVLNLSVTSSVAQSYKVDPLDAAVELLWFHGIVVVVAAGNEGTAADAVHYPPANDPFVITVGAFDDQGTNGFDDDALASWSSRGTTQDGFAKPDVLAPGVDIVSPVSADSYLATTYPQAIAELQGETAYFTMSGTSMATAVVSGIAALVRQAHPEWTPGEVKYVLTETTKHLTATEGERAQADKAVKFKETVLSADDGLVPNFILLAAELNVEEVYFDGIRWRGIRADGSEIDFDGIRWRDSIFNGIRWRGLELNGIRWRDVDWTGIRWRNVEFSGIRWRGVDVVDFDGIRWRGIRWRGFVEN